MSSKSRSAGGRQLGEGLGVDQRARQGREAAELGRSQAVHHAEQQAGVAFGGGRDLVAHPGVEGARRGVVQQGGGVRRRQRGEAEQRQSGELRVHRPAYGHGEHQGDSAARGETRGQPAEGGPGGGVPQVGVGTEQDGPGRGGPPQRADQVSDRAGGVGGGHSGRPAQRPEPGQWLSAALGKGGHDNGGTGVERAGHPGEDGRAAAAGLTGQDARAALAQPLPQRRDRAGPVPLRAGPRSRLSAHSRNLIDA
ncbi:hypothetical protein [Streptomyces achromogenes]|uniref:hypothetical protein n=1 Tax=Streptomyces achromogenes TaxID=67255 RepID=UPI0004C6B6A7|nr:hypothetical protein [Streptomyces achromogenes]